MLVKDIITWLEKQDKKERDTRYKYLEELLEADTIYQMAMNDAMVEEAKAKALEAISNMDIFELLGLEKQSEQKVSYTTTVETGDGGINALVTRDIEIPFGAKDSELQEATYFIPKGYYAKIEGDKVVIKKGEEKPATIDVDKMVDDYAKSNVRDNEEFGKPLPCMIRAYRQGLNDAINEKNDGSERL